MPTVWNVHGPWSDGDQAEFLCRVEAAAQDVDEPFPPISLPNAAHDSKAQFLARIRAQNQNPEFQPGDVFIWDGDQYGSLNEVADELDREIG